MILLNRTNSAGGGVIIMKKKELKTPLVLIISALVIAMYTYGLYSFHYEYLRWSDLTLVFLNDILVVLPAFVFGFLAHKAKNPQKTKNAVFAGFICAAVQQALIWGITYLINIAIYQTHGNRQAIAVAECASTVLLATVISVMFIRLSKKGLKPLWISLTVPMIIGVAVLCVSRIPAADAAGCKATVRELRRAQELTKASSEDISFAPVTAAQAAVSAEEKEKCRSWFEENILNANSAEALPAYNFSVEGKSLHDTISQWTFSKGSVSALGEKYKGGETTVITLKNNSAGLSAEVEATIYPESATCEWTVWLCNDSAENSGKISDFNAIDCRLPTGDSTLYYALGSSNSAEDFTMFKVDSFADELYFHGTAGRSSDEYMPYFNISGEAGGCVVGIGWTGRWLAGFSENEDGTSLTVHQQTLSASLLPGEKVRSPLVSVTFYGGGNASKGFNSFRGWISECVYPDGEGTFDMLELAGPFSTKTSDELLDALNAVDAKVYDTTDYLWMDAGWYKYNEGWHDSVGDWTPDTARYDNGIIELSKAASERGLGLVLWYEPERVREGTELYNNAKDGWLIENTDDNYMWNLANDEACDYLSQYISASLKENGVSVYRQDFNYEPLEYWAKADKTLYGGRDGICENHYITNLYEYLDALTANVDGLLIDNCASGGRRLDLEMTRRSVPYWRSDYNCDPHDDLIEATQAQTLRLSFWLPINGTSNYVESEYAARSAIMPTVINTFGTIYSEYYHDFSPLRDLMTEAFYPLTTGNTDTDKYLASQYSLYDGSRGFAVIYRRADAAESTFTAVLSGLDADAIYSVYSYDAPEAKTTLTGAELMNGGFEVSVPEAPQAVILMFDKG